MACLQRNKTMSAYKITQQNHISCKKILYLSKTDLHWILHIDFIVQSVYELRLPIKETMNRHMMQEQKVLLKIKRAALRIQHQLRNFILIS